MRLLSIELTGFRGFPVRQSIDLSADAIVVVGANGHGKTSLFDGILWALSGRVPRLSGEDERLVSMYSETGQATVTLGIAEEAGQRYRIIRSFDGSDQRLMLETPTGAFRGASAEGRLVDLIWPEAGSSPDSKGALAAVLTRCVYLQQDLIRNFVEATSEQDRFSAVSELVGAGRVTEFQSQLERAKRAWSQATNQREAELRPLREQMTLLRARLTDLTSLSSVGPSGVDEQEWQQWIQQVLSLGVELAGADMSVRQAPVIIDQAVKRIHAQRLSLERRLQEIRSTEQELAALETAQTPNTEKAKRELDAAQEKVGELKEQVRALQAQLAELRQRQAELREKDEQLRALAALALKHLGERCPVCAQTYNVTETRSRLESIVKSAPTEVSAPAGDERQLQDVLARLTFQEKASSAAALALRTVERAAADRGAQQQALEVRARRLAGLQQQTAEPLGAVLRNARDTVEREIARASEVLGVGEVLAVKASQASASTTIAEVRSEIDKLGAEIASREKDVKARAATGDAAQQVIERLREAASAVVGQRLESISPLLQSIYARIDPHPAFRAVSFLSRIVRGKGQLATVVTDPVESKTTEYPATVLSSSQVNALAVSAFLALNLGLPKPPVSATILDDPLQSLDDINLLGLVDLLRRVKDQRQLLIGTHDLRFGALLARKLRPRLDGGRTLIVELDTWTRRGPSVNLREVSADPVRLRLAEANDAQAQ